MSDGHFSKFITPMPVTFRSIFPLSRRGGVSELAAPLRRGEAVFLLFLITLSAASQNVLFKIGGGVASHTSSARPVSSFMGGVAYEYEFSQHWGVSPGLFVQSKGWRAPDLAVTYDKQAASYPTPADNPDWNPDTESYRTGQMSQKTSLTYLTLAVPFNYYLRTSSLNYVILSAGPFASYGLQARRDIKGDPLATGGDRIGYTEKGFSLPSGALHRFDAGLQAQAAYQFSNGITVGLQGDFSLLNSLKAGTARNISGLITLSYNFHQAGNYRQRLIESL